MRLKRLSLDSWMHSVKNEKVAKMEGLEPFEVGLVTKKEGVYKYANNSWFEIEVNGVMKAYKQDVNTFNFLLDCLNVREYRKEDIVALNAISKSRFNRKKHEYLLSLLQHNKYINDLKTTSYKLKKLFNIKHNGGSTDGCTKIRLSSNTKVSKLPR